jgi:hypothetical protein
MLPASDFALDYARWDHRQRLCRECASERDRERRKKRLDIAS